jgi:muconolactone delta-isomerase
LGEVRVKILALERDVPGITAEACRPYLQAEAARAWELYQAGVLRELYFRQDRTSAVLILECAGAEAARDVLDSLPLVKAGLIAFDIIPLRPYPGFARLFGPGERDGVD